MNAIGLASYVCARLDTDSGARYTTGHGLDPDTLTDAIERARIHSGQWIACYGARCPTPPLLRAVTVRAWIAWINEGVTIRVEDGVQLDSGAARPLITVPRAPVVRGRLMISGGRIVR